MTIDFEDVNKGDRRYLDSDDSSLCSYFVFQVEGSEPVHIQHGPLYQTQFNKTKFD